MGTNDQHTQLSDSARRELTAERDRLRSLRDQHEAERRKADGLLVHLEAILTTGNGTAPHPVTITSSRPVGGLREAITAVMAKYPHGIKPVEITRTLEDAGYVHTGSTSLALSVSNTMFRMAKAGDAQRSKRTGKYRLVREDETEAAGE